MDEISSSQKLISENGSPSIPLDETFVVDGLRKRARGWCFLRTTALLPLLVVSAVMNMFFVVVTAKYFDLDKLTIRYTTRYWSPIMDAMDVKHKTILFDSTLFGDSAYRGDASLEVDQLWQDLGLTTTMMVDEADAAKAGFSPGMVKRRASDGGGFVAQLEVFHQLHCLDTLRQGLYFNYDYFHENRNGVWGRSDALVRKHMGHCLDLLRMQLQCTSDLGLVGMMWVNTSAGNPIPFADFTREHKCRDFEAIRAWANQVDEKGVMEVRPGDKVLDKFP